ncbi:MAG TPA: response regulator [Steroidobacteraceae bacterium]|jgi:CheY-like chemotaxis protein|nr:response regulator [Steroidobacteraceae bacterium]
MATVLVVDDNAVNRKLLVTLLSGDGHLTLEASDGLEGLQLARAHRPQLVISDIVMPTMDGYGFVRAMRADPTLRLTPVIFYTAHYHEREAHTLAQACGVVHVVVKPSPAAELLRIVEQVMAGIRESVPDPLPDDFDREHLRLVTDKLTERAATLSAFRARFEATAALAGEIGTLPDSEALLERVCSESRRIFGASYAVAAATEGAGRTVSRFSTSGIDLGNGAAPRPSLDPRALDAMLESGSPWRTSSVSGNPADVGLPESYPPARAFLAVPLATRLRVYGWLCLANKIGAEEFDADDEKLVSVLATLAGLAWENLVLRDAVKGPDAGRRKPVPAAGIAKKSRA